MTLGFRADDQRLGNMRGLGYYRFRPMASVSLQPEQAVSLAASASAFVM